MSPTGSIQSPPSVANTLLHTDNEAGEIKKEACNPIKDNSSLESSHIFKGQSTVEQADKILLFRVLLLVSIALCGCCGLGIFISWVMTVPALIFLGGLSVIDLYLQRNDPNYDRRYA